MAPMLGALGDAERERLAERAHLVELVSGDWLFRRGDAADALYVLLRGRIDIVLEEPEPVVVRELARGDALGELGLLTGAPRSASARARRDALLLRIERGDFEALISEPRVALNLSGYLARELQESRSLASDSRALPTAIAVLPLAPDLHAGDVVHALLGELGKRRPAAVLEPQAAADGPAEALDRVERDGGQLVMVIGEDPDWTRRCLRQADALVLLGGDSPPRAVPELGPGRRNQHLMLPGSVLDRGRAGPWLSRFEDATVTRVDDLDQASSVVARRLAGAAVGVVLSGGGARGFAHIGALAELSAAGIRIDRVGGVSMGSIVGALFASGFGPGHMEAMCREAFVRGNPLGDYTLPLYALVRGGRAYRVLHDMFGERRIEQLQREYFCVSCDLNGSKQLVHRRGSLVRSVGASSTLPGISPPVRDDQGRLLVDGGVLNNLPVETMAAPGHGPVIAIDVTSALSAPALRASRFENTRLERYAKAARRAFLALDAPLPTVKETLFRSVVLGSIDTVEAARRHADLTIVPDVQGVGIVDFAQIDEMIARGRAAARAAIADAPAALFGRG
jgi:NTE family protein